MAGAGQGSWRYAPGGGLLLGSGSRWLLLDDVPEEPVITALWEAVTGTGVDQALAVLERAYDGRLPAVAAWDDGRVATRGSGTVEGHELRVGLPAVGPWLPVIGGIVAGAAARLDTASRVTDSGRRLIDGIPDDIATSRGPDVPARYSERRAVATTPDPEPETAPEPEPEPEPEPQGPSGPGPEAPESPAPATASTGEAPVTGPHPDRVTGRTTRRTATGAPAMGGAAAAARPAPGTDHDGHTSYREAVSSGGSGGGGTVDHLRQPTHDTVLAAFCARGHPTPAYSTECRVCNGPVPPQDPQRVPRPRLGGLRLPGGEVVALDRPVVIGRRPTPVDDQGEWPHLVTVPPEATYVSRVHLHIQLDGWLVVARDLASRGGTTLRVPGRPPESIRAGEPHLLEPGQSLDLADEWEVVYEVADQLSDDVTRGTTTT